MFITSDCRFKWRSAVSYDNLVGVTMSDNFESARFCFPDDFIFRQTSQLRAYLSTLLP